MKAVISPKAGPPEVLQIQELEKPIPKRGELLVKVHCATVTAGDVNLRRMNRLLLGTIGLVAGFKNMKVPGVEYSGVIESVGEGVSAFAPGDAVRGTTTGLAYGANAEYVAVPEKPRMGVIIKKAAELSHRDAAAATVGPMTAMQLLQKAAIRSGESLLVYGASGSVGSFAIQLGKHYGATVIGVCSAGNTEMVGSLGADSVIDYQSEDFTKNGRRYDVIFDAVGKLSKSQVSESLASGGRFVGVRSITKEVKEELQYIQQLQLKGELKPFIDGEYALDDIVEAHRRADSGRKRGNIVIPIVPD
jgi:NADPH:quinone reductase-like Zn-dependent oxidoreductase